MTAWAIRVICDATPDPTNPAEEREQDVISELGGCILEAQAVDARKLPADTETGAPERYLSLHRVPGEYPLADVLDAVEARLGDRTWYRVDSHVCHHDETPPQPCEAWTVERTFGSAPEGV